MRDSELRWTVALEAALFFSMQSWWLMAQAWPANGPWQFALAVVAGATAAAVLFHVIPAMCAPALASVASNRIGRAILSLAGAWLCIGAAIALGRLARTGGSVCIQRPELWDTAGLILLLIAVLTAWRPIRRQRPVIAACLLLGASLAVASTCIQLPGLHTRNSQMVSEPMFLGAADLLEGMLMASAPAAILAYRIGRPGASRKTILWTGIVGLWVPLCASATLICVAMMCGTRLHWKPSLPVDPGWAFGWLLAWDPWMPGKDVYVGYWMIGATTLAPSLVCVVWIKDLTDVLSSRLWKVLAWSCLAGTSWFASARDSWRSYGAAWISSITLVVVGIALLCLAVKLRR